MSAAPLASAPGAPPAGGARELGRAALAAAATLLLAFGLGPRGYAYSYTGELVKMIHGGPAASVTPIAYRVLVPFLLRCVPLPPRAGFLVLAFAASLFALLGTHALLRRLGIAPRPALVAMVLLGFSYPIALYLSYWGMVDPLASALEVLLLVALVWRRPWLGALALVLGCLTKESGALLVPLFAWWFRADLGAGPRARLRWLACVLAPLAAVALLRALVHAPPGLAYGYAAGLRDYPRLWRGWAEAVRGRGAQVYFGAILVRSFGFAWLLAALGFARQRTWRGACAYLLACGVALACFGNDHTRMLGFAFAGVFVPAAVFLDRLESRRGAGLWMALLVVLAAAQCAVTLAAVRPLGAPPWSAQVVRLHALATAACFAAGTLVTALAALAPARTGAAPR